MSQQHYTVASAPVVEPGINVKVLWFVRGLCRRLGFDIVKWEKGYDANLPPGVIVQSPAGVKFFVANEGDHIQRFHLQGRFYEAEELELIGRYFRNGVFVDIGANVGNHSLYAALI